VMIAAIPSRGVRRAAELAGPDDQRFVQEAAGFQVLDEAGDRLIGIRGGVFFVSRFQVAVLIPRCRWRRRAAGDLDEAYARFDESAGAQTLDAVKAFAGDVGVEPVEALRSLGFPGKIEDVGHERLHAVGQFVIADGRFNAGGARKVRVLVAQQIEHSLLRRAAPVRERWMDIVNRRPLGMKLGRLMIGRRKPLEKFSNPPHGTTPKLKTTKPGKLRFSLPRP